MIAPQYIFTNTTGACDSDPFNGNVFALGQNKIWMLTTAGMIFLMQLGMALFESGSVRRKNSGVVFYRYLIMNLFGLIGFWAVGYAFAFADPFWGFIGGKNYYFNSNWVTCNRFINEWTQFAFWSWQYAVGLLSCSLILQMTSERLTLKATALISLFWFAWVYAIDLAWTWGTGWMQQVGFYDFAGSGVWAVSGTWAGLAALWIIGTRYNRWNKFEDVYDERMMESEMKGMRSIPVDRIGEEGPYYSSVRPSKEMGRQVTFLNLARVRQRAFDEENDNFGVGNLPFLMMGGFLLWVGFWYLSSGATWGVLKYGSYLGEYMERAAISTLFGGVGGGLVALFLRKAIMYGARSPYRMKLDAAGTMRGFLAGIVASLAGAAHYEPWAAFVCGLWGGLMYVLVAKLFDAIKWDDPPETFATFWGGGSAGLMVAAFVDKFFGIFYGNPTGGATFGYQLMGLVVLAAWNFVMMAIFCWILRALHILRVDVRTEVVGYDYVEYADEIDFTGKKLTVKKIEPDIGKKA